MGRMAIAMAEMALGRMRVATRLKMRLIAVVVMAVLVGEVLVVVVVVVVVEEKDLVAAMETSC